jgi:hypothetical protein
MSEIPIDLKRRLEQRWAARFGAPVAPVAAKRRVSKSADPNLPRRRNNDDTVELDRKTSPASK